MLSNYYYIVLYVVAERTRMTAPQHSSKASSTMEDHVLIYCRSTMVHNTIFTANNTMTRGQQHTHTTMYVHYTTASISVLANRTVYSTVVVVTMCLLACALSQYSIYKYTIVTTVQL